MNLDVRIKTTAEGQGAQQAAEGLKKAADNADILRLKLAQAAQTNASLTAESDKVTKSAKESAEVFKELFKVQEQQEKAVEKYDIVLKEVAKSQEKWNLSKSQAVGALKKLREAIPGLGYVIDALKNPYAAITAAIAAFVLHITKQIEKQRELEKASLDLARSIDTSRTAMDRAKGNYSSLEEAADAYLQKMREIADQEQGVDATTSRRLREVDRQTEIGTRQEQARLSAEERQIDAMVAEGKMSPAAAETAKAKLRAGSSARTESLQTRANAQRVDIIREGILQQSEAAAQAEAAIPEAEAEARRLLDRAEAAKAGAPGLQAAAEAELTKLDEEIAKAEVEAANKALGRGLTGLIPYSQAEIEGAQSRVLGLQRERASVSERLAGIRQRPAQAEQDAQRAVARVKTLQDQSLSARRSMGRLEGQGQDAAAQAAQADQTRNAIAPFTQQEDAANAIVAAAREAAAAAKAKDAAVLDALKQLGINARSTEAQVKAQAGR